MSTDPMKATKDFFDSIVAQKPPTLYLTESASNSSTCCNVSCGAFDSNDREQSKLSLGILRAAAVRIPRPLTHIYEQEELSRKKGASLVRDLVNDGDMRVYQYHPSRRGGAMKIPRITDKGWIILKPFGISPFPKVLGGGWQHDLCGKVLGAVGKRQHYQPSYEVLIGQRQNVRIDVALAAKNRPLLYCQCCFSSADREVEAAIKVLSIIPVEVGRIILVCRDKALSTKVHQLLNKNEGYKQYLERISVKVFGDVLEHFYKNSPGNLL